MLLLALASLGLGLTAGSAYAATPLASLTAIVNPPPQNSLLSLCVTSHSLDPNGTCLTVGPTRGPSLAYNCEARGSFDTQAGASNFPFYFLGGTGSCIDTAGNAYGLTFSAADRYELGSPCGPVGIDQAVVPTTVAETLTLTPSAGQSFQLVQTWTGGGGYPAYAAVIGDPTAPSGAVTAVAAGAPTGSPCTPPYHVSRPLQFTLSFAPGG